MKKRDLMEMLNEDLVFLESLKGDVEKGIIPDADLDSLASVEFIEDIKEASKKFDEYLEGNRDVEFLISQYIDHFGKATHVILENQMLWTPHAISAIRIVIEGH